MTEYTTTLQRIQDRLNLAIERDTNKDFIETLHLFTSAIEIGIYTDVEYVVMAYRYTRNLSFRNEKQFKRAMHYVELVCTTPLTDDEKTWYEHCLDRDSVYAIHASNGNSYCIDCFDTCVDNASGDIYRWMIQGKELILFPGVSGIEHEDSIQFESFPSDYYAKGLYCKNCKGELIAPRDEDDVEDTEYDYSEERELEYYPNYFGTSI